MARTRSGADLIDDALKRSDNEGATDRHPRADVLRYVNQAGAELWDLLTAARGGEFFQKDPAYSITTTANTSSYSLPSDLYILLGVRLDGETGRSLAPFDATTEPALRASSSLDVSLLAYRERRVGAGTQKLELLPLHQAGLTVKVDYVPAFTDLTDSSGSSFDGINGWEEYVVVAAARTMAIRDEERALAADLLTEMERLRQRINALAPKRDLANPRRVKDVRGPRVAARGRWWWW